jgi:hypothetical protein
VLEGDDDVLSLRSQTPRELIYANLLDRDGEKIIPLARRP